MDQTTMLFDSFKYGMSREEIAQRLKIANAAPNAIDRWTLRAPGGVNFLQETWEESFDFNNNDALRQIILTRAVNERDEYLSVQEALLKEGWTPVAVDTDEDSFDAFRHREPGDPAMSRKALDSFEKEAIQLGKEMTVYFFPSSFADKVMKNLKIKFWTDAMDKARENFCLLSLMVNPDNIRLSFSAPLLSRKAALKYGEMIKK